jgi:tetratricopeptide (TPR) repeat protein
MSHSAPKLGIFMFVAVFTAATAQFALAAEERADRTGSRLGSDTTGRTVVHFGDSGEVRRVRALLDQGLTDDALALAEDYLASLDSAANGSATTPLRYAALNALCAALTGAGRLDEAVGRCTEAMDLLPSRWSAINNRGTAHFLQRNYVRALEDYRRAGEFARGQNAAATVQHNIELTERRLAQLEADR